MKTVGLISLGCPKNLVDSEVMLGLLEKAGYRIVQDPAEAEILIVNTCGFIESAKKESVDAILEMSQYKVGAALCGRPYFGSEAKSPSPANCSKGRCEKLIVTGCLPQRYKDKIAKLLPEVDLLVGTGEYQKIVKLLCGFAVKQLTAQQQNSKTAKQQNSTTAQQQNSKTAKQLISVPNYIHSASTPRKLATAKHAVYVKIAEGCFHACSFCIIPKLRGKFRSRPIDDIMAEAKMLIAGGAKELNLIAQDTTSYGKDLERSRKHEAGSMNLAGLLKKLSLVDGDFWIRIMYAYPTSITNEFITAMAELSKVCKYLDIPIQHISDKILKAMRRREKGADIRGLIKKLREKMPDITLRTSLIVGFPGETKKEFGELLAFVKEGHFDHLGVFAYSKEEGTFASKLKGHVFQKVKKARRDEIMKAQAVVAQKRNMKLIGKTVKVLIDVGEPLRGLPKWEQGQEPLPYIVARTEGQAPEIDSAIKVAKLPSYQVNKLKAGKFADIKIIGIDGYDLIGELC